MATDWQRVLEAQRAIQQHFPECVLVEETAAALHVAHRVSLDGDHVMTNLHADFPQVLARLEALAGWHTARTRPPVLILGRLAGVETGIRQLRRSQTLETETIAGIRVPTLPEMIRVKGWLVVTRNATRDYVDFCALAAKAGDGFTDAIRPMDRLYPQDTGETVTRQLAKQLAEPKPYDLGDVDLARYRGLRSPWNAWPFVHDQAQRLAKRVARDLLGLDPGGGGQ
jgi:hypothetical protein